MADWSKTLKYLPFTRFIGFLPPCCGKDCAIVFLVMEKTLNCSNPCVCLLRFRQDERKEVITTKVWVEQEWTDSKFTWNPADYGGVRMLHVPAEEIWKPDIVLYNNADGKYEITTLTKAQVFYNGLVRWMPPALYLTSCRINVEFFPYDEQECSMRFGSWTYDGSKVELRHHLQKYVPEMTRPIYIDYAADLYEFNSTIEFEVLSMSATCQERYYKYSHHAYPEVTFKLRMRRRTIFYTFNLMMPCVAISALMLLTFYLPPESREKISLSINIFISLTLFFLLISETIPPTSLAVPLLGKYLLFTIILITSSIVSTVLVLSLHFRSAKTHVISAFTRTVFLGLLPRLMRLNPPRSEASRNKVCDDHLHCCLSGPYGTNKTAFMKRIPKKLQRLRERKRESMQEIRLDSISRKQSIR
ncbi:unnamed protein product [Schistocephalus solidus]|uniref:Neurotransmitter-gated ion-channel ligand binding domain protein n=1 Tax=Schistocephalus solidus TaxID=70667 RepID=A0A183SML3_SCHSO|nr:unnamed protein product [Schistocephalus solidus]